MINNFKNKRILPYIMIGDPDIKSSFELLDLYVNTGCKIIEIGVPFSDPSADGKTIQEASQRARKNNITIHDCLDFISKAKVIHPQVDYVLMSYYNPILRYGLESFIKDFEGTALIIPDLPFEEQSDLKSLSKDKNISIIPLISINSSEKRIKQILKDASGFIYLMTVKGLTGTQTADPTSTNEILSLIRDNCQLPVVAGFGIKTKEQINAFFNTFDGVVIASELIKLYQNKQVDELINLLEH